MRKKSEGDDIRKDNSWDADEALSGEEQHSATKKSSSYPELAQEQGSIKKSTNPSTSLLFSDSEQGVSSDASLERIKIKKSLLKMVNLNTEFCRARHKMQPNKLQRFFGLNNTEAWQTKAKILRVIAEKKLFGYLDDTDNEKDRYELLLTIMNLPLFKDHRHNYFFTGAFGRTDSYIRLEAELKKIEDNLSVSDSSEELTDTSQISLKK